MDKKILAGKLEFTQLFNPIKLFTEEGEVNLWDFYHNLFTELNDKKTSMTMEMNKLIIHSNLESEFSLEYKNDEKSKLIILKKIDGFGFSNIGSYLPDMLQRLNGRKIIVTILEEGISIENDSEEKVFELYYTNGNSCAIPEDKIKTLCKIGTNDTCIFCTVSSVGFECAKFDSYMARQLLYRYSEGTMNASRIGNCAIVGRKEN